MITVSDLGLRRAFACALGGDLSAPPQAFNPAELARLTQLSWTDTGEAEAYPGRWKAIARLDGVERCTQAVEIALNGNQLRDLGPLAACVAVEQLWLGCNDIVDLGPVAALPRLRRLSAYDNPITSLAPLRAAKALQILDLGGTRVTDFSPLLELPRLGELSLSFFRAELDATQIEVLAELRARGVNVAAHGELEAQIQAALAQRTLAKGVDAAPALAAAVQALRSAGLDAIAAALLEQGPEAQDAAGRTALHQLAVLRPEKLEASPAQLAALVPLLVAAGVDPLAQDHENLDTALSLNLFNRGDFALFQALLAVTEDLERPAHRTALTHAFYALQKGWPQAEEEVQALRAAGAALTAPSALVMAARAGAFEAVFEGLEAGADPESTAHFYSTDSLLEVATRKDALPLMRALLERGASATRRHPIREVRSAEALALLMQHGATLPELDSHRRQHPLHRVVSLRVQESSDEALDKVLGLVDALVALGQSVDVRTWEGHTPIGKLVDAGSGYTPDAKRRTKALVDKLFAAGADPRARSAHGRSAMDFTRRSDARDFVKAHKVGKGETMAKQDAKKLAKAKSLEPGAAAWPLLHAVAALDEWALTGDAAGYQGRLRAMVAAKQHPLTEDVLATGDLALAAAWLQGDLSVRDPAGRTILSRAVRVKDPALRRRLVLGLIAEGADPAVCDWSGETPLTEWLYWGAPKEYDAELFEALARPGAMEGAMGRVALSERWDRAVRRALVAALIERGAPCVGRADFEALVRIGEPELLEMAVQRGASVNATMPGAMISTPLGTAIEHRQLDAARWLLERGAAPNGNGYTVPLHKARSPEAVALLLAHGADPGQRRAGHGCDTALHVLADAAQYNFDDAGFDALEALLAAGADPRALNTRGDTPLGLLKRSSKERAKVIVGRLEGG
ncbi:MAG: hypothetical protein H6740_22440 [Alphaproteobacteria bacterium]|nr:hypothetical protein [Alphaproteobacteria bacterium]